MRWQSIILGFISLFFVALLVLYWIIPLEQMEFGFESLANRLRIFSMVDCSPTADENDLNKRLVAYKLELKDLLNESITCRAFTK